MARITLKGAPCDTIGNIPAIGTKAPAFTLTRTDLSEADRASFAPANVVLNIFPSVDTSVCAASVRHFNAKAASVPNTRVLCVSMDLPFALIRFCGAEGLDNVTPLSAFRHPEFGKAYGVSIVDGPLAGLFARAVIVINDDGKVAHAELVPEITQEPDYEAALKALV